MGLRKAEDLSPLPPGRHGLSPEYVAEHQRRRIMDAMAELVAKRGYRNTAVHRVCNAAAVAPNTFYQHFDSKEACFLAIFDDGVERASELIAAAIPQQAGWADRINSGLGALVAFVAEHPALARNCIVESLSAGPAAIERYEALTHRASLLFRHESREAAQPAELGILDEALVRGLAWLLKRHLVGGEPRSSGPLLAEMVQFASLMSFVGDGAAPELPVELGGLAR